MPLRLPSKSAGDKAASTLALRHQSWKSLSDVDTASSEPIDCAEPTTLLLVRSRQVRLYLVKTRNAQCNLGLQAASSGGARCAHPWYNCDMHAAAIVNAVQQC